MIVLSAHVEVERQDIRGMFFAWCTDRAQPAAVRFRGDDRPVLPLFSSLADLREAYAEAEAPFDATKVVREPEAFVLSFAGEIRRGRFRLLVHRGKGEDGRRRYVELVP